MKTQERSDIGTFVSPYDEPRSNKPVSVRLPKSLDRAVRSKENYSQWIIDAVREKFQREEN
jgi:hypothetical protein